VGAKLGQGARPPSLLAFQFLPANAEAAEVFQRKNDECEQIEPEPTRQTKSTLKKLLGLQRRGRFLRAASCGDMTAATFIGLEFAMAILPPLR